jgi:hypothetical protein
MNRSYYYFELGFTSGTLAPLGETTVHISIPATDDSSFYQNMNYSYAGGFAGYGFIDWKKIAAFYDEQLVYGTPPSYFGAGFWFGSGYVFPGIPPKPTFIPVPTHEEPVNEGFRYKCEIPPAIIRILFTFGTSCTISARKR